jgi:hypothetical protein
MKEKVKSAGGNTEGELRCSLEWYNYDDLDLHLIEPSGYEISFRGKMSSYTKGKLDVDMNAGGGSTRTPVENIIHPFGAPNIEGSYELFVHQYEKRENQDIGFRVEIECQNNGEVFTFEHSEPLRTGQKVSVATFNYSRDKGLTFQTQLNSTQMSKEIWNLSTNKFYGVNSIMFSPNHWDEAIGNKHLFFMIKGAENQDPLVRGFFNEFLKEELTPHKRVFEAMAGRMEVASQPYERQLSGIGFSTTQRDQLVVRVKGHLDRVIKVVF